MEFRPILSAMLRNKTGAILVGLQIALTLAVVANSVSIIMTRAEKIGRPPGIDSENLIFVQSYGFGPNYDQRSTIDDDLRLLRSLPGVVSASPISQIPMSGGGSSTNLGAEQTREKVTINTNHFSIDEHGVEALGVKLVEGRNFTQSEIQFNPDPNNSDFVPFVILNKDAAKAIFGTEHAVGKTVYDLSHSAIVIGIMDNMLGSWVGWDKLTQVMLTPRIEAGPLARYVVRAQPGRRDALIADIEQKLSGTNPNRAITYVRPHQLQGAQLSRRQPHGRIPQCADRADGLRHGTRHRRPRELPRERPQEADRHASRGRCASCRHHQVLHARELDADDRWRDRRQRACLRLRAVVELCVLAAAAAPELRRGRCSRVVDTGSAGCVPAGPARGGHPAGNRHPDGMMRTWQAS